MGWFKTKRTLARCGVALAIASVSSVGAVEARGLADPIGRDGRIFWLLDSDRGCVAGPLARVAWQLRQLRSGAHMTIEEFSDEGVVVYRVRWKIRKTGVQGATVYASDAAFCWRHLAAAAKDNLLVRSGGTPRLGAGRRKVDATEYFFPGHYGVVMSERR